MPSLSPFVSAASPAPPPPPSSAAFASATSSQPVSHRHTTDHCYRPPQGLLLSFPHFKRQVPEMPGIPSLDTHHHHSTLSAWVFPLSFGATIAPNHSAPLRGDRGGVQGPGP